MGFPRQAYWSGLPFPSSGDLPDPGTEPESPALVGGFFTTEPQGEKDLKRKRASWNQRTKANKQTSNNKAYSNLRIYLHSLTKDCSNVSRSLSERNKMYSSPWNDTGLNVQFHLHTRFFQYIQTATVNDPELAESVDGELKTRKANSGWVLHPVSYSSVNRTWFCSCSLHVLPHVIHALVLWRKCCFLIFLIKTKDQGSLCTEVL